MKKLIYILALCLCLNGVALAAEVEESTAPVEPAAQQEQQPEQKPEQQSEEKPAQEESSKEEPARQETKADAPAKDVSTDNGGEPPSESDKKDGNVDAPASDDKKDGTTEQPATDDKKDGTVDQPASEDKKDGTVEQPASEDKKDGTAEQPAAANKKDGTAEQPASDDKKDETADAPAADENKDAAGDKPAADQPQDGEPAVAAEPEAPGDEQPAQTEETPGETPEDNAEARFETASGTLEELLEQISGKGTIYLRVGRKDCICIKAAPLKKLSDLKFEADREIFKDGEVAYISTEAPDRTTARTLVDVADYSDKAPEETAELYFWADKKDLYKEEEPAGTEPEATPAPQISVAAENCTPGQWSAESPTFTLSGIPEGATYTYAAIVYDERIIPLSGNTYVPEAEGQYNVRFAMLDGIGDIVSASDTYAVWLDFTEPEDIVVEYDEETDYTFHITASDGISGVAGISLDGGATWTELGNDETFDYTAAQETTLSVGAVQVKDAAGNIWRSTSEIVLEAVKKEENGGYGGYGGYGGGDGGEKKAAPSHASGDGEETPEYETVELELPEEPMTRLTVGGAPMELTLVLDAAEADDAPVGEDQPFTAQLRSWCPAPADEDAHENVLNKSDAPRQDTLLLTAVPGQELGDEYTYTWHFNGEVYRLLANSGIKYVALQVGDDIAAFPTEGFIGGTRYTELKMLGVSTRKFDYTLTMRVNRREGFVSAMSDSDFSQACDLSIRAEVENMAYELSSSTNSIMYFYDVYLGPEDMLTQPFGAYRAE